MAAITDIDSGWKKLLETAKAKPAAVQVGSDAEYAAYVEYGTEVKAPRPFVRPTLDAKRDYADGMAAAAGEVFDGKASPQEALDRLGAQVVADVKATIEGLGLVSTGHLRESIKVFPGAVQ